jgi:putative DNA primase/helicase
VNLTEVAGHFDNVKRSGTGYSARCSVHDDRNNSLSLSDGDIGVQVFCHVCGKDETENVLAAVGLTFKDLMNGNGKGHRSPMNIVTTYPYRDETGAEKFESCRLFPKDFRVRRPDGTGGHIYNLDGVRRVPYRLPELLQSDKETVVYIVEGEKDVDRIRAFGLRSTCNLGGAGKWRKEYNRHFAGRPVVLIPDNDDPGRKHAQAVAASLHGTAASIKLLNLPGLPEHGDVSDWLDAGHDVEELVRLEEAASPWTPAAPVPDTATGEVQLHIDSGLANMERLVRQHHHDVRYLKGPGWYAWDGRRFAPDAEAELVRRAIATVRTMYHEAAAIEGEKARTAFLNHIRRSESEPEIRRMVALAQSHRDIYITKAARFDSDPMLLNLHNGTLDLRTRALLPHRREDQLTKLAGCVYDPNATCPTWTAFLETIFAGDQDMIGFVQRLAGYCMTGEVREHVLPIFWGDGANGKTTFINTILAVLGEYATTAPPDLLVVRKHKGHPTELMDLMGARFAAAVETPLGAFLDESLVKNLTGGDRIKARYCFKDFVEFPPTHKLLLATNHRPAVHGTDGGIWRRLLLIPFAVTIAPEDQDEHLLDKLTLELTGILNWTVQGCTDWQETGLKPPKQVRVATKSYREESDHLPGFIEECCVIANHAKVEKGTAFAEYTGWCQRNAESPMPKLELGRRFKALGAGDEKSNGRRFWTGIGLAAKDQRP